MIVVWVRECERQLLTEESVVSNSWLVESISIEIVCLSRMGGWFVILVSVILVSFEDEFRVID